MGHSKPIIDNKQLTKNINRIRSSIADALADLDALPQDYWTLNCQFRVTYFPRTPSSYIPQGFVDEDGKSESFRFLRQPKIAHIGRITTKYHTMSLHAKSTMYSAEDEVQQIDDSKHMNPFYYGPNSQRLNASNNERLDGEQILNKQDSETKPDRPNDAKTTMTISYSSNSQNSESDNNELPDLEQSAENESVSPMNIDEDSDDEKEEMT